MNSISRSNLWAGLLAVGILFGVLLASRLYALSTSTESIDTQGTRENAATVNDTAVENRWNTSGLLTEIAQTLEAINEIESALAALSDEPESTEYAKLQAEAESAAQDELRQQDPLLASAAGVRDDPLPSEAEFRVRRTQIMTMTLFGANLLNIGIEGERFNDIFDILMSLQTGNTDDPAVTAATSETNPFGAMEDLLTEEEYAAWNESRQNHAPAYEKTQIYYATLPYAPDLSDQTRQQVAEVLAETYRELIAQSPSADASDRQRLRANADGVSRERLETQLSVADMEAVDLYLEARRIEQQRSIELQAQMTSSMEAMRQSSQQ